MGFLDLRRVPSSAELYIILLSMCIDASESATNSRSSGLFEVVALPDRVPHRKQCQHFAFLILLCPIQPALQISLSELQILLKKSLTSFLFKEFMKFFLFGENSFLFRLRSLHTLQFFDFFCLSTAISRILKMAHRPAPVSQCL